MPLHPADYLHKPLPALLQDLAIAATTDVPGLVHTDVELHGPGPRANGSTRSIARILDGVTTVPESTRLPSDHPDVDVPGVVLEQFLGGGGQGWVYAGRVRATDRVVAVKVFAGDSADAWGAREALLCARVRHPNVLRILQTRPVGAFWVVLMELVQGQELRPGSLTGPDARACFRALADALAALGRSRLVHRDVKPANVILRRPDGSPVLIDFGLAIDLADPSMSVLDLSGTPFYMAPEAWRDSPPTPAWDAYALGITAAVVLAGPPDVRADLASLRHAKLSGEFERQVAERLRSVDDNELRTWIGRLIDADPDRRTVALADTRAFSAA